MPAKFITALRNEDMLEPEWRWYLNPQDGQGATVTYAFPTAYDAGMVLGSHGSQEATFVPFGTAERMLAREAFAAIAAQVNLHFVETTSEDATIRLAKHDIVGAAGYAFYPVFLEDTGASRPSMAWVDRDLAFTKGSFGHHVILHEVGHALGLSHSFDGDAHLSEPELAQSTMSYSVSRDHYGGYSVFEIAALQSIYGPALKRLGNDVYAFGKDKLIWDGGGTDTVDASKAASGVTLDLNDGTWNHVGKKASSLLAKGQVYIGDFTVIENGTGSKHADKIRGNALANTLKGGAGDDSLQGRAGDDLLSGGSGKDVLDGGAGRDRLSGGTGDDRFVFSWADSLGTWEAHDRILDFRRGDRIDLRGIDGDLARPGDQRLTFLGSAMSRDFSPDGKGKFYFDKDAKDLVFDFDGDGQADHWIDMIAVKAMAKADFYL